MLYLTYDNESHTDGAGAQLQRILSIYLLSRRCNVGYIHTPILKMSYQGAMCLEENKEDNSQIQKYNDIFAIPSTRIIGEIHETHICEYCTDQLIHKYIGISKDKNVLLKIAFAHTIVDKNPGILLETIPVSIAYNTPKTPIVIAVHVRRGELFVLESSRMLPNSYYVDCMREISKILTSSNIPHEFHLHTEVITKPTLITSKHHGIFVKLETPVLLTPEDSRIEDFNVFENIKYRINEEPTETLKALCTANILLCSRSSFSYVAAIMNKSGVVLFHPFWHALSPEWVTTRSPDDIRNARGRILSKLTI